MPSQLKPPLYRLALCLHVPGGGRESDNLTVDCPMRLQINSKWCFLAQSWYDDVIVDQFTVFTSFDGACPFDACWWDNRANWLLPHRPAQDFSINDQPNPKHRAYCSQPHRSRRQYRRMKDSSRLGSDRSCSVASYRYELSRMDGVKEKRVQDN